MDFIPSTPFFVLANDGLTTRIPILHDAGRDGRWNFSFETFSFPQAYNQRTAAFYHQETTMMNKSYEEWRRIHNRAARDYINSEWSRENLFGVAKKRQKLFSQAAGSVLDVGCGYGNNFPYLVNATQITGIDFSRVMLEKARETASRLRVPIDLREGSAEALDFPDNSFDTVTSSLSTCSFYDPIRALQEIRRVCKVDGQILLIEHGRSSWEWLGKYQDRHVHEQIEQGGCRWNQEPQDLVREAGIKILHADRSLLGIFHSITASPAKAN